MRCAVRPCSSLAWMSSRKGVQTLRVFARMKQDVKTLQSEVTAIDERLRHEFPDEYRRMSTRALELREKVTGPVETLLLVLLGAVACLLLLASANVASLLLGRGVARRPARDKHRGYTSLST